jgi:hypothetical protein
MTNEINPYQSPETDVSVTKQPPLPLGKGRIFVVGAILGCISFVVAIALIPASVPNPSEHDLLLANHLGFIFPPLVGAWAGWLRRSWLWGLVNSFFGIAIGGCYYLLCGYDFLAVQVAFPCLLGGVASVAFGIGRRSWFGGIVPRLGKGLLAGFVLGFVYMVVLTIVGISWFPWDSIAKYHEMMWCSGTVAMTVASSVYLVLFVWASNLQSSDLANPQSSMERANKPF